MIKIVRKLGGYVFDETRSVNNRPHEHLYARIRGEWYDFAQFNHPGGPIALNLAKDRDATALFESHHLLSPRLKMEKILSKFKVDDKIAKNLATMDERDDGAHYEWDKYEEDPFVNDMKQVLIDYFRPIANEKNCSIYEATKASSNRWLLIGTLYLAFVASLPSYIRGEYWTLFVTPQLTWICIANYWHDCLHFSLSSDWRINAWLPYIMPFLSSPWLWYHQHVIGHHAYTNIGFKDPDLAHAPQLLREHKSISWKPLHESQGTFYRITAVWSIAVSFGLNILSDVRANMKLTYNNVVPYAKLSRARFFAHMLGRLLYIYLILIWPFQCFAFWKALIWATIPTTVFSLSFMVNSQINHLTEECSDAFDTNFLKHQVVTAQNFGVSSWFCGLYSGHLNYQIEHHLFPFVNHCHLPYLAPIVEKVCLKHNVAYRKAEGYIDAFQKHFRHTREMSTIDS
jgi:fatty acid desaturase